MTSPQPSKADWAILAKSGITPDNLTVHGSLYLSGTDITALPDNLTVHGSLLLRGTNITVLCDNLTVHDSLYLEDTGITALPDSITVGRSLYLKGTPIPIIYHDPRGYELRRVMAGSAEWWVSGCRKFTSRGDALAYWGSPKYPNRKRGDAYCAAINATEMTA